MRLITAAFLTVLLSEALTASEIRSVVTNYQDSCKLVETLEESADEYYSCKGYQALEILQLTAQDSSRVSFGPHAAHECVFNQSFQLYSAPAPSIEWRVDATRAIAAIQIWSVSKIGTNDQWDEWIVVTKLDRGNMCHIALIQATLTGAGERAQMAADKKAASFDCKKDVPEIIADSSIQTGDLTSGSPCGTQ